MALSLRDLVVSGVSLDGAERMLRTGYIGETLFASYYQLWRRAAPRFAEPYVYRESDPIAPDVVGPLAAATVARFLSYLSRGVLFL